MRWALIRVSSKNLGQGTLVVVKAIYLLVATVVVVRYLRQNQAVAFNLQWTNYALLPLFTIPPLITLVIVLNLPRNRNRVTFWYSIYTSISLLFMVGEAAMMLSADKTTYSFWYTLIVPIVNAFIGPILICFVMAYLDKEELIFRYSSFFLLLGGGVFAYYMMLETTLISDPSKVVRRFFGYPSTAPAGPLGSVLGTMLSAALIAAVFILVKHYLTLKRGSHARKQAGILVLSIAMTIFLGVVGGFVLPLFHLKTIQFDFITNFIGPIIASYAILKYKLLRVSPATLSRSVINTMNESMITFNNYQEIELFNPAAAKLFNSDSPLEKGMTIGEVFGPLGAKLIRSHLANPTSEALEINVDLGKATVPISMYLSKMQDTNSDTSGFVVVFRDITKERAVKSEIEKQVIDRTHELKNERARLEASINSLDVGYIMTDLSSEVVTVNQRAGEILDAPASPKTLSFSEIADILKEHVDLPKIVNQCLSDWHIINLKEVSFGNKVLHIFVGPILTKQTENNKDIIGCVLLINDITESIMSARSKDEFFSIASHELRTPLTSIRGNSSMMLEYYADSLKDPALKEMLGDIHESSTRLIDIVNDFLDVSRIEQGKIKFNIGEVAIDDIIEKVAEDMKGSLKERKLYLKVKHEAQHEHITVAGDVDRVKQVFYNLIGNAVRFTDKGGVTVFIAKVGEYIKVSVTDTGRGISPEGQALLFRKFQQAGNSLFTRDTSKGTGLGLYISKLLVEGMGGQISLDNSSPGTGSTFSFTLLPATSSNIKRVSERISSPGAVDTQTGISQKHTYRS